VGAQDITGTHWLEVTAAALNPILLVGEGWGEGFGNGRGNTEQAPDNSRSKTEEISTFPAIIGLR
jgi:hypothetical protein